jgi:hypothetical protein
VDLGGEYAIGRVVVWNRNDTAKERLSNFRVMLKDGAGSTVFTRDLFTGGGYPDSSVSVAVGGVAGRVVRVQLLGTDYLNLAEVEVFGGAGGAAAGAPGGGSATRAVYTGRFRNSVGGQGAARLEFQEQNGAVQGVWDGDAFTGHRQGNSIRFELKEVAKGCRDYQVRVDLAADGATAKVAYQVRDRCKQPAVYSGWEELTRQ